VIELYDTSALILAARDAVAGRLLADALAVDEVAICEPILIEYLNGARNVSEYDRYEAALRATRFVSTTGDDWAEAVDVHRALARSGAGLQRSVKLPDLIIAATAARAGLPLVHFDADYDRIASITGQPTRWILPRPSAD
jgi:predicted nucleic acid-binding protein